jgi:predicted ATPase
MDSIRIRNLRCLEDTGLIKLDPLTILLGQNSSGKSTFIRTFPLLKQGTENNSKDPLCLYGEYVDFGTFKEALNIEAKSDEISISFRMKNGSLMETFISDTEVTKNTITHNENSLELLFKENQVSKLISNGREYNSIIPTGLTTKQSGLFRSFNWIEESWTGVKNDQRNYNNFIRLNEYARITSDEYGQNEYHLIVLEVPTLSAIDSRIISLLKLKIKDQNKQTTKTSNRAKRDDGKSFEEGIFRFYFELVETYYNSGQIFVEEEPIEKPGTLEITKIWNNLIKASIEDDSAQSELTEIADLINFVCCYLRIIKNSAQISDTLENLVYTAPIRSYSQRFYRETKKNFIGVDHTGENLANFISNLELNQKVQLNSWLSENFGLIINVRNEGSHISMKIKLNGNNNEFNITDMGFGFSQTMPILISLWNSITKQSNHTIIYTIEQPELHLHPKLQGSIAKIFANAIRTAKENEIDLRLIIETHSETIINKIGELVEEQKIHANDINVVIFEKEPNENRSNVRISKYDEKGLLTNWPWGFFE